MEKLTKCFESADTDSPESSDEKLNFAKQKK